MRLNYGHRNSSMLFIYLIQVVFIGRAASDDESNFIESFSTFKVGKSVNFLK